MDIINPHLYLIDGEYYINYGSTKKMLENLQSFDGWIIEQL